MKMLQPISRTLFSDEHEQFRRSARMFVEREVAPHVDGLEAAGIVSRALWERAGSAGLLGLSVPERYGLQVPDRLLCVIGGCYCL